MLEFNIIKLCGALILQMLKIFPLTEYMKKRQMSTTGVALPDSSENLVKLDVWLVPAITSATVAFLSIAVVVAIIWKLRKSIRAMPPFGKCIHFHYH